MSGVVSNKIINEVWWYRDRLECYVYFCSRMHV